MADPTSTKYQPRCMLSHEFANDLSVIIGNCELLEEEAKSAGTSTHKIEIILSAARRISDELRSHVCALEAATRNQVASQDEARRHKARARSAGSAKE
jgi:nitrogen-specific signal transduction histidine kinase